MKNIPLKLFQMSWMDGGFSFQSLRDRRNPLVIRTVLDMTTSLEEITRRSMRQFGAVGKLQDRIAGAWSRFESGICELAPDVPADTG
jgi:hypothetical protein